jgi:hypothetical protein
MGTGGSFPGRKAPGGVKLTTKLQLVPGSRMMELCVHSAIRLHDWCLIKDKDNLLTTFTLDTLKNEGDVMHCLKIHLEEMHSLQNHMNKRGASV